MHVTAAQSSSLGGVVEPCGYLAFQGISHRGMRDLDVKLKYLVDSPEMCQNAQDV